jgi:phosphoenolpyruvate---glycerone phosphotransferase subunit DhaM
MVGLVLVSHSPQIAEGTAELVRQMAGEVELAAVGGDADGTFGTDPERIKAAIENLDADEALIFMDLGSAVLSAETVLEMLSSEDRERVRLVDAPFVEGAFAAGVIASTGADADECVEAAMEARTESKLH